jgi:glycerol kinase
MVKYVLAIDQGTTSSRAILFDQNLQPVAVDQREFPQHFPDSGWVEHDPEDIWSSTLDVCRGVISRNGAQPTEIAAIGITNQRETTVVWDRETGQPIHNAIVWQDRRTSEQCAALKDAGHEASVTSKTGLLLDPYFSGTKVAWILENVEGARAAAHSGKLAFGTIDTFLLWRLTEGRVHATDATNASRTMLYNIHTGAWDDTLLELLNVPRSVLPDVHDTAHYFGDSAETHFGTPIPIASMLGDQQAATVGQACFQPGMMKSTYGTGCFALLNTGSEAISSQNRLLTTIAYQLDGVPTYALEGSIFVAGAAVQWLRDEMGLIADAAESGELAALADENQLVYLVPAFVGMGAPYWDAECRGAIFGLTRASGPKELAKAALESVCYQTRDLLEAMQRDWGQSGETVLRVDGGMVASDWTMQRLSDLLPAVVERPLNAETTALGAAYLAGMKVGFYPSLDEFAATWKCDHRYIPSLDESERAQLYAGWQDAVRRTLI